MSPDKRNSLTVAELLDLTSRAHSVIDTSEGRDEHGEILGELAGVVALCRDVIGASHMGCAADAVILMLGIETGTEAAEDVCSECGNFKEHALDCSYHERCPWCGEDSAEHIGDTATGAAVRLCSACNREWEHRPDDVKGGRS